MSTAPEGNTAIPQEAINMAALGDFDSLSEYYLRHLPADQIECWIPSLSRAAGVSDAHLRAHVVMRMPDAFASDDGTGAKEAPPRGTWSNAPANEERPRMNMAGFHGVLGRHALAWAETTRSMDPHGIMLASLVMAGNVIGRGPHQVILAGRHGTNLYGVLGGPTGGGKSRAVKAAEALVLPAADENWRKTRRIFQLSSGEGMVVRVAGAQLGEGEAPRLMIRLHELEGALDAQARDGCTLSSRLREAFDGDEMQVNTKEGRVAADLHHLSMIAAIPDRAIKQRKRRAPMLQHYGWANRMLDFYVHAESEAFPQELAPSRLAAFQKELASVLEWASKLDDVIELTPAAVELWKVVFKQVMWPSERYAEIFERGHCLTRRVAMILALLDGSKQIDHQHINAAAAIWFYSRASVEHILGGPMPVGSDLVQKVLVHLQDAHEANPANPWMLRSALFPKLGGHVTSEELGAALKALEARGWAESRVDAVRGKGRRGEYWRVTGGLGG